MTNNHQAILTEIIKLMTAFRLKDTCFWLIYYEVRAGRGKGKKSVY